MVSEAQNTIADQQKDNMDPEDFATSDAALDFADALDLYAEEVLPSKPSGSRKGSSASSRVSSGSGNSSGSRHRSIPVDSSLSSESGSSTPGHSVKTSRIPAPLVATAAHQSPTALRYAHQQKRSSQARSIPANTATTPIHISSSFTSTQPAPPQDQRSPQSLRVNKLERRITIGRHTVRLTADRLWFNSYSSPVKHYPLLYRFFDELPEHSDKLDALDQALTDRGSEKEWHGIPGWTVHLEDFILLPSEIF